MSHGQNTYSLIVLIWFLAQDSAARAKAQPFEDPSSKAFKGGKGPLDEAFRYYNSMDFWVICDLSQVIKDQLSGIERFMVGTATQHYFFVSSEGESKLAREQSGIWEEFALGESA